MPRTAGGKVLGISATAPVTIAGEAVRCPRDPAATARRDSATFHIPAEWHGLNVLEESCFLSGAVCQPHQQLRDFLL